MNYQALVDKYGPEEGKRRWVEKTVRKRRTSGFAAMTKEQALKIQSLGGKAAQERIRKLREYEKENGASQS